MAGANQLAGPMNDRPAVRTAIHQMVGEAAPWDHFIMDVSAYPNRTMDQTKFIVDCCREVGGDRG